MDESNRVQVFARVRPPILQESWLPCVEVEQGTALVRSDADVLGTGTETGEAARAFAFDGVFPENASQQSVFAQVGLPVLQGCLQGFNGTILAYGQTGSGKTYSLLHQGPDGQQYGLLPRLAASLFLHADAQYQIEAAALQVYNEQVDDLLHVDRECGLGFNLTVQNGGVVPGLSWVRCSGPEELLEAFTRARSNLIYAETRLNKASSRSHAVFQVKITRRRMGEELRQVECTSARLNVVDLAGSERVKKSGVEGAQLKEALAINKSLLVFGNVVSALASHRAHVPFRESKLTRILDGSIGGNSRTSLLVCVSPAVENVAETLSALEFASRAMRVEVHARVNRSYLDADVAEAEEARAIVSEAVREEVDALKRSLELQRARADQAERLLEASVHHSQNLEQELAVARRGERELLRSSEDFEARALEAESESERRRLWAEEWRVRAEASVAELAVVQEERDQALRRAQKAEQDLEEEMESLMAEVEASAVRDLERQREADDLMLQEQERALCELRSTQREAQEWRAKSGDLELELSKLAEQLENLRASFTEGTERTQYRHPLQSLQNLCSPVRHKKQPLDAEVLPENLPVW